MEALLAIVTLLVIAWYTPTIMGLIGGLFCLAWELFGGWLDGKTRRDPYA